MPSLPAKSDLRATSKAILATITPPDRARRSDRLAEHLLGWEEIQHASTILAYAALPTEISLDPFIIAALGQGKRLCVPRIEWDTRSMHPAQIRNLDADLTITEHHIRTPTPTCPLIEPDEIDLVLIPGLAFDRDLNRLGRGAGFYDRMIETMPARPARPGLVGVCFADQIVERVPTEPHDHPMDRIITEAGLIDPHRPPDTPATDTPTKKTHDCP